MRLIKSPLTVLLTCAILPGVFFSNCQTTTDNQTIENHEIMEQEPEWDIAPRMLTRPKSSEGIKAIAESGIEGTVVLSLDISSQGFITRMSISESSGNSTLDSLIVESMRDVVYSPAIKDGKPIACTILLPNQFRTTPFSERELEIMASDSTFLLPPSENRDQ